MYLKNREKIFLIYFKKIISIFYYKKFGEPTHLIHQPLVDQANSQWTKPCELD